MKKLFVRAWLLIMLTGCVGLPDGVSPVQGFNLDNYLGTWYEIARLDHRFERGLSHVTAAYSLREDGGVRVRNRGFSRQAEEWEEAEGVAYFVESADTGYLKVSFFGPFYGAYVILALDDAYQMSLVSGPDREYLWLLSRTPEPDQQLMNAYLDQARALGFPVDDLIYVDQQTPPPDF